MDQIDTCVIGAGVVGLAVARALALKGIEVLVVDQANDFGQGTSSRNSEVIHAGIYYAKDSAKARWCVRGKEQLYEYCESRHVPYRRIGKLIVATRADEEPSLADILDRARGNGVNDLEVWDSARLATVEPQLTASLALFSPSTGIVSSRELMRAYLADVEAAGGMFVGGFRVEHLTRIDQRFVLKGSVDGAAYELSAARVVNSGGLGAQQIAASCELLDPSMVPPLYLAKGNYFMLSGSAPFSRLIYPVPEPTGTGLGIHATLDLGGQVRFGPDVQYIQKEDYAVDETRLEEFVTAIRRFYPGLVADRLVPGYAGIRPKLQAPGQAAADFMVQTEAEHRVPGLVNLFGIESPGLTSALAIADHVAECLTL